MFVVCVFRYSNLQILIEVPIMMFLVMLFAHIIIVMAAVLRYAKLTCLVYSYIFKSLFSYHNFAPMIRSYIGSM